ncbi:MAG: UDP-N-acetylglucosamine 1-carboxyvinyltransferase [Pseudomonadota bacterium]|nr:UDP-N-acetylglucosamine 1-carboxyvinyltransferase [Pseudomonadota bacterium]
MDSFIIRGGTPLQGRLAASGSKNAALPIMAATLLAEDACELQGVPVLRDVTTMITLLASLGASVSRQEPAGTLHIESGSVQRFRAPYDLVKTMRASILVLGPLLARFGRAEVSFPGGCAIGSRPVDLHIRALEALGARISVESGYIIAEAPGGLRGADFSFDTVTVGGTENAIMAAVLARGESVLRNVAREPEIGDLVRFLRRMGADIVGDGTDTLMVQGVSALHGASHRVMPDRIEVGTYLVAAAATRGHITIDGVNPDLLGIVLDKLQQTGADLSCESHSVALDMKGRRPLAVDIETQPFPGFPTDMQAQFTALNAIADGRSRVTETIFENRLMQAHEMRRMGADIEITADTARIVGRETLQGAPVMASDLRASASLVIAGLVADGETRVDRIYHIDRGYEDIEGNLQCLGADIRRIST